MKNLAFFAFFLSQVSFASHNSTGFSFTRSFVPVILVFAANNIQAVDFSADQRIESYDVKKASFSKRRRREKSDKSQNRKKNFYNYHRSSKCPLPRGTEKKSEFSHKLSSALEFEGDVVKFSSQKLISLVNEMLEETSFLKTPRNSDELCRIIQDLKSLRFELRKVKNSPLTLTDEQKKSYFYSLVALDKDKEKLEKKKAASQEKVSYRNLRREKMSR